MEVEEEESEESDLGKFGLYDSSSLIDVINWLGPVYSLSTVLLPHILYFGKK